MKKIFLFLIFLTAGLTVMSQTLVLTSPNQNIKVSVHISQEVLSYSVADSLGAVLAPSNISMELGDGRVLGRNPKVSFIKKSLKSVHQNVASPFYRKSNIDEQYNELTLFFKGNYQVVFRAYDNGVAYRFETHFKDSVIVRNEYVNYSFNEDYPAIVPYVNRDRKENEPIDVLWGSSFENLYTSCEHLSDINPEKLVFLPMMVSLPEGRKVVITESDLRSYPGMYLRNQKQSNTVSSCFATRPKTWQQGGHNNLQYQVQSREDYIAKVAGTRTFPWRVMAISHQDKELANNDLVYLLAKENQIDDMSWIKPGKVAWDWWNDWNIWGVDFEAGINNDTYKYYIDFASQQGIEYVILDEGWAVNKRAELFQVVPEIDLPMLVQYARERNVGIVLWAGYAAMDKDMERVCKHYSEMGVKGFKVDFMDRDDQIAVDFYERMAATAAKYHLFIDFHGAYKPTGLSRTYPNVLNYEGVFGLEQAKWISRDWDMVTYDVTIPFIRMLAGPLDYTQGAMRNASKWCFSGIYSEAMSQGTRCHQLAEYVVFDAPFAMLCDAPTAYLNEKECTEFIATVPTVWDETRMIDGRVGEYVITAKRKADTWYIAVLNNWQKRSFDLDLSWISGNATTAISFTDGVNAHRKGCDYKKKTITLPADKQLHIDVASGGGAVIIINN